jgi:hypothetical protein
MKAVQAGGLAPHRIHIASDSQAREWLRQQWKTGSVADIQKLAGLRWVAPDIPLDVKGKEAVEGFFREDRKRWIKDNHELIISKLIEEKAA